MNVKIVNEREEKEIPFSCTTPNGLYYIGSQGFKTGKLKPGKRNIVLVTGYHTDDKKAFLLHEPGTYWSPHPGTLIRLKPEEIVELNNED
jgi:hypothetical protein